MIAVVAIMALSVWAGPTFVAHPVNGETPALAAPARSAAAASASSSPAPSSSGLAAACALGSHGGPSGVEPAASPHPATTGPSPLYNSAVVPYAVLTGHYDYEAAGAALRDQGYGKIDITWTGALVAAYMIWSFINNSVPPANATLNGDDVTGTWTAYATPSPCWSPTYIYTFVAPVTNDVVNGVNSLTGFPSAITNGYDPWNQSQVGPMDEGASLVVVNESTAPTLQQVTVYTGALTDGGGNITAQLNYSTTNSPTAKTTYIIADGQLPGNEAWWNGTLIDANAFPGSDPKESPYPWSYGNLSDTVTFTDLPVVVGSNNTTATTESSEGDCFTWTGQVLSVGVPATKGPYPVVFAEQGLPNGVTWGITTDSTTQTATVTGGMSSIAFSLGNGSYSYSVSTIPAGYTVLTPGAYSVDGGPVYIRVAFHQVLYPITFNETGLPTSTVWYVTLTNSSQDLDQTLFAFAPGGIQYLEGNGTYNFTTSDEGLYLPQPPNGTLTVSGAAVPEVINFVPPPLYPVTFMEQGLPTGTTWGAETYTNWGDFDNSTSASSFELSLPNATVDSDYLYPGAVPGYLANSTTVYFGVYGAPETIDVNYSQAFAVTFIETGLVSGSLWYVYFGASAYYSTSTQITIAAADGSYSYTVPDYSSFVPTPASGMVTVHGTSVSVAILFVSPTIPTYSVNFTETGLAARTNWSVTLNYYSPTTNGTYLNFTEANGSYPFEVASVLDYSATPSTGTVNVSGGPEAVAIAFTALTYAVTFTETGLPSGATWYINVTGEPGLSATVSGSTGTSLVIDLAPAMYAYTAATSDRGWSTPRTGSFTVSDAPVPVSVPFTATGYLVTFTETGLPSGATWYINITGETGLSATVAGSSGTSLTITLPLGSYNYAAATNWKNWTTTSPGTFTVSAVARNVPVPFTAVSPSPSSGPLGALSSLWLLLAIILAILVLVLVFVWYRRRKKAQPPPPPPPPPGAGPPGQYP